MSKFIDKMNLPQYRYFQDMLQNEEEWRNLISDAVAGIQTMKSSNKKVRVEGLLLFSKAARRIPEFLYRLDEDQKQCRLQLGTKDKKKQEKELEHYLDLLLALPSFQGKPVNRQEFVSDEMQKALAEGQPPSRYKLDKKTGRYYLPYTSVPKLLLVNGALFEAKLTQSLTSQAKEDLEGLLSRDVHYIICVQSGDQSEKAYLVKLDEKPVLRILEKQGCTEMPVEKLISQQNDLTAVLLCLQEYLQEIRLAENQRRRFREDHPDNIRHSPKDKMYPKFEDKNAIKVFDLKDGSSLGGFDGGIFYLKRNGDGLAYRKAGYEMAPHTRKGHYRTYKNGKTVYVKSAVIHKEKYEGIQSAHRINQEQQELEAAEGQQKPEDDSPTMGLSM